MVGDSIADCVDGDLRLVGGDSENDGVLQVCFNKRWGTVNGDGWTNEDTQVACRQLGFNSAGSPCCNVKTSFTDIFTPFPTKSLLLCIIVELLLHA